MPPFAPRYGAKRPLPSVAGSEYKPSLMRTASLGAVLVRCFSAPISDKLPASTGRVVLVIARAMVATGIGLAVVLPAGHPTCPVTSNWSSGT